MRERSSGVSYQGKMMIAWCDASNTVSADLTNLNERNARLLKALLLSQESHRDLSEETSDLMRVEAKLDLLLDMVSQFLQQQSQASVEADVVLWSEGISWSVLTNPLPGNNQRLWLSLYIDADLTQPLKLLVQVTAVHQRHGRTEVEAEFIGLDEQVMDLLGKFVFRQHRRFIAQQKALKRMDAE
ncbi:PilZ domain-containing protein [Sedimenticola selenatireducens]|uniref:Cyclic di-GMP receptor atypical PilZ domain-containing protein n=1 Tax=Sedimenticola selenatireducens TaxID=191960 RepID=A0A558E1F1_9GAMM|nr:PilZ domain-containing protein [Sedimenticola selenatireducens]TVO79034.1 hypothetical protein FHP88_00275 [Sedimenticola selenatireducens]TVT67174.1 MAG: hypothetical protein FHK78_00120 [Sedimenticola selenatireducens]